MQIKMPKCPKCGSNIVTVTDKVPRYAGLRQIPKTGDEEPEGWTVAFKCTCGLGFTDYVKNDPPAPAISH